MRSEPPRQKRLPKPDTQEDAKTERDQEIPLFIDVTGERGTLRV